MQKSPQSEATLSPAARHSPRWLASSACPPRPRQAGRGPRLVDGQYALCRIARKDRFLRRGIGFETKAPNEFEIGSVEFACQNIVYKGFRPAEDWRKALFFGKLLLGLGSRAVKSLGESLRRDRESKADNAREPLVKRALEFRFLRLDEGFGDAAWHELGPPAAAELAIEIGVPIFLVRRDLIWRPIFWDSDQTVWNVSVREIIEKIELPAQGDIDRRDDLLDWAQAIDAINARVAWSVDNVVQRIVSQSANAWSPSGLPKKFLSALIRAVF